VKNIHYLEYTFWPILTSATPLLGTADINPSYSFSSRIDILFSPSYTSAIAQSIQTPGVSGLENNIVLFELEKNDEEAFEQAIDNFNLVKAGNFDVLFLASDNRKVNFKGGIHIWIHPSDDNSINLMIMLSFIMLHHPDWKKAKISVFVVIKKEEENKFKDQFTEMVISGRIPITMKNIQFIKKEEDVKSKDLMQEYSIEAGLVFVGIHPNLIKHKGTALFADCEKLGDVVYVYSNRKVPIE